jgi:hypothetical protein
MSRPSRLLTDRFRTTYNKCCQLLAKLINDIATYLDRIRSIRLIIIVATVLVGEVLHASQLS